MAPVYLGRSHLGCLCFVAGMIRYWLTFWGAIIVLSALALFILTLPAHAIKVTAEVKQACGGDVVRFCLSHTVGNNRYRRLLRCLKSERANLSPECRAIIFK